MRPLCPSESLKQPIGISAEVAPATAKSLIQRAMARRRPLCDPTQQPEVPFSPDERGELNIPEAPVPTAPTLLKCGNHPRVWFVPFCSMCRNK